LVTPLFTAIRITAIRITAIVDRGDPYRASRRCAERQVADRVGYSRGFLLTRDNTFLASTQAARTRFLQISANLKRTTPRMPGMRAEAIPAPAGIAARPRTAVEWTRGSRITGNFP
jgi:hypothetical protein